MFGTLLADQALLTQEEAARYRACYCGLCRDIQERFGGFARLSLSYDMTFLTLLLSSLYEPEETAGEARCPRHPRTAQPWLRCEWSDYAADMNVALAYLKCLDDWEDEGEVAALAESRLLRRAYDEVAQRWPRQCEAMARSLEELHALERAHIEDADAAAASFGRLMGAILAVRDDRWQEPLDRFGQALGRFLYVMDAALDVDKDAAFNRYNPFRRWYGLPDCGERFGEVLRMQLGEALYWFDRLPLVQDTAILKSILCAGVWIQFNRKYKKEDTDGTRSV